MLENNKYKYQCCQCSQENQDLFSNEKSSLYQLLQAKTTSFALPYSEETKVACKMRMLARPRTSRAIAPAHVSQFLVYLNIVQAGYFLPYLNLGQALPTTLTCNNSTQFDCQTTGDPHRCIPLEWLCDGLKDCKNGLDESHCSYLHSCPEGNFICRSGDCVSGKFKCDGEIDCPGGEDEKGCDYPGSFGAAGKAAR
ncbi:Low-density lipoprotein receptor domain class A [Ancylostoma caninum]|uniref:Low-density lipoprotein receptor domain class A n=1 Tax=Ancylostoma caninum TaxID=29170 RepID=A0A368GE01_ANCCA|nr:Low-density lipoprotein receptor domain class A [Ancylostoma caninum]